MSDVREIVVTNADTEFPSVAELLVAGESADTPKVSVVMPVYNVEPYLRQCLDSVLGQSLREIELICVDDGSTDGSVDILKEYAARDARVTIIRQKNCFAGVARNAGLTQVRGEYVAFLDSDDFFELDMLEKAYEVITREKSDIVFFQYINYDSSTGELGKTGGINTPDPSGGDGVYTCKPEYFGDAMYTVCNPMPWNKLIRTGFIRREGIFFQGLPASNDVYFSLAAMACAKQVTLFYTPLVYYRHNRKGSLRNTRDKNPFNFWKAYKLVAHTLRKKGVFKKFTGAYLRSLISSCYWSLMNVDAKKTEVRDLIQNEILPGFKQELRELDMSDYLRLLLHRISGPELVVSLTSYPGRIGTLHQVVETLLTQSLPPDRLVLWLAPEQFPNGEADLPSELLAQKDRGLIIDWYHDVRSYKKLIPTLKRYPKAAIVTADDDILYHAHWLKDLYEEYGKHRDEKWIFCQSVTRLYQHNDNLYGLRYAPFFLDQHSRCLPGIEKPSAYNKLRGGSGTLYPPGSLHPQVMDEERFMRLAPTSDDLWFYMCVLKNGYRAVVVPKGKYNITLVEGSQETALCKVNDDPEVDAFGQHLRNLLADDSELKRIFDEEFEQNEEIIRPYVLADMRKKLTSYRIDARNLGAAENSVDVKADGFAVSAPGWLNNEQGGGKLIMGQLPSARIELTANGSGTLKLWCRGNDYRVQGQKVPVYVDFKRIQIDGGAAVSASVWCDAPHIITIPVSDGQRVVLEVEVNMHADTDEELIEVLTALYKGVPYVEHHMGTLVEEMRKAPLLLDDTQPTEKVTRKRVLGMTIWKECCKGDDCKRYLFGVKIYTRKNGLRSTLFIREKKKSITYRIFGIPVWRQRL